MSKNSNLQKAKKAKDDEFYTRKEDIEKEILENPEYVDFLKGKTVLCNCDDPEYSNFFNFFVERFRELSLKKLITTHYNKDKSPSYRIEYTGETLKSGKPKLTKARLKENGDFRSGECVRILKKADVVITNPPFSLLRDFISQLMEYDKAFLIIGNKNIIKYKDIFPLFCQDRIWPGYNSVHTFIKPDGSLKKFGNIGWFTNIKTHRRAEFIPLIKEYSGHEADYPKYDGYDAIEVSNVKNIPSDYTGIMGVPVSFIDRYNPEQFEIIGEFNHGSDSSYDLAKPVVGGVYKYPRIAIRKK